MTTASYAVTGLTCGHCIAEVMEHVRALAGVTGVAVDLVRDGSSPLVVTSGPAVGIGQVREALGETGFALVGKWTGVRRNGKARVVKGQRLGRSQGKSSSRGGMNSRTPTVF